MKISEILISYLQNHKRLSLPGLGVFTCSEVAAALPEKDALPGFPAGSVSFTWNSATPEDPALIAEISSVTGKIKPLASSDLEALVIQGKQLINISKPFTIEGLGSLQKTNKGEIEFLQLVQADSSASPDRKFDEAGEPIQFTKNYLKPTVKRPVKSRNLTVAGLLLVGLVLLGWVGYGVYRNSASSDKPQLILESEPMAIQDTTPKTTTQQNQEDLVTVQTTVDSSTTQVLPENNNSSLDKTLSSVSSIPDSSTVQQNIIAKADSVAKPIVKKPRKKTVKPAEDSVAARISIPIKTPELEMTAPVDSVNHQ